MLEQPCVPDWIREFSYPGWTNVFQLVPKNDHLYPVALRAEWKLQFNDWNGTILLLAKDGCPTRVISEISDKGEPQPWRFSQKELGDEGGWRTNQRLYRFASAIPGGKLYGSAAANMLYDLDGWSRALKGFKSEELQDFLQRVLIWVVESMPRVKWVACLGEEAWFLASKALGDSFAATQFKNYRESYRPIGGVLGKKRVSAFPLYHPAALGNAINEMGKGWRVFASLIPKTPKLAATNLSAS